MRDLILISSLMLALALAATAVHADAGTVDFDRAGENAAKAAKSGAQAVDQTAKQAAKGLRQAADEVGGFFNKAFGSDAAAEGQKQEGK